MKFLLIAAAALCGLSSQASAQSLPFTYNGSAFTLAYNLHNNNNGEMNGDHYTLQFSSKSDFSLTDTIGLTFASGYNMEQWQGSFYSKRNFLEVNPYYNFGAGTIGVYGRAIMKSGDEIEKQYGLSGSYASGAISFEGYLGRFVQDDGSDFGNLGVAGTYAIGNGLSLYAAHRRDTYDSDSFFALTSLGADYDFSNFASGLPVTMTVEYSKFSGDNNPLGSSDWDQVSLMFTYSLRGGKKSVFHGIRSADFYYD